MKREKFFNIVLVFVFILGLSLLLYPSISNFWNGVHQSKVITEYSNGLTEMDRERYASISETAKDYNRRLADGTSSLSDLMEEYPDTLDPMGAGTMGYIKIPSISCTLPIAHGTDESVLQDSIGHVEWSSLPTGGPDTHCVLSGHRGLPSAELLTNIDHMEVGDTFSLHILNEVLEYQVDEINVVEPNDSSKLQIEPGMDFVTLLTCTPYGINTHRLLVRGRRIEQDGANIADINASVHNEIEVVSSAFTVPVLFSLFIAGLAIVYVTANIVVKKKYQPKRIASQSAENGDLNHEEYL